MKREAYRVYGENFTAEKTEDGGQSAEDRRQKSEDRNQKTEDGGLMTELRSFRYQIF